MKFKVVTVFNRLDGFAQQVFVVRNENTFAREFVANFANQNEQLKSKKMPTNNLSDFAVRLIGEFDDETCVINPLPVSDIPFNSENNNN